jgi:hypothetical protein
VSIVKQWRLVKTRIVPLLASGLLLLLAVWIVLAPAEARLGQVVKLIYVHGALVWAGLLTFGLAGLLGLVALLLRHVIRKRAAAWYRGTRAAGLAALVVWIVYTLSAVLVTGLTWGQWIAWGEPRVRATGMILLAAVAAAVAVRLVDQWDFTAMVNVALGIAPWIVVNRVEAVRHPVNPIGGSGSAAIQGFYLLIVLTVSGLAATLIAWLWAGVELAGHDRKCTR